ncbi:MAG: GatB/YqeY domain-containing protein [bacterium]|nr:GatB/YqeY domain-containing protein [bacterium]
MTLAEQITADLRLSLKAGDVLRLSTLRLLQSQITNQKIALRLEELPNEELQKIVQREIKKRREASEAFAKGGRMADSEKELAEQKILEAYLPAQISDADLEKFVVDFIGQITGEKNIGKITGAILGKLKGQVDGGRVKAVVERMINE